MYWASRIYRILSHRWIRVQNTRKVTEISCLSAAVKQLCCENSDGCCTSWLYICLFKLHHFPKFFFRLLCTSHINSSADNLTVNFPFSRDCFSLSLRYFSVSGNGWHRSTFLFMTLFCFGKADLYSKNRKAKRKKTLKKCRSDFHAFSSSLSRIKRTFIKSILPPSIN